MVMGAIVPVVNLEGIKPGELVFDGATLANIYLGKITKWDDPAIKKLNPNLKLPSAAITVVRRSDGSGTTFNFTDYLSKASEEWKTKVGSGTAVEWPAGVGAKGNEGVAGNISQTRNSIGYVEYAYAKPNNLIYTAMINRAGKTVQPTIAAFQAAAANADWAKAPGYYLILTTSRARRPGRSLRRPFSSCTRSRPIRRRRPKPSNSSPGLSPRATKWPRNSITSQCPTPWSS
jgi:phosphate transport system substrate-binding protein